MQCQGSKFPIEIAQNQIYKLSGRGVIPHRR